MATRPTVWVVKEQVVRGATGPTPMDYTPAYKYGDVKFITDHDFPITRGPSGLKEAWHRKVRQFLYSMNSEHDYLVLTGSPFSIFLIGFVCAMCERAPKVLIWRRESNEYVPFDMLDFAESIPQPT
jgi:hypothetical protein